MHVLPCPDSHTSENVYRNVNKILPNTKDFTRQQWQRVRVSNFSDAFLKHCASFLLVTYYNRFLLFYAIVLYNNNWEIFPNPEIHKFHYAQLRIIVR